jgi:hypothetical protein
MEDQEIKMQTSEVGEGANNLNQDKPDWLPEKFESAEELAKAYGELEKKMGGNNETQETPEQPVTQEQAEEATGIQLDKFYDEFADKGELTNQSYEELAKQGLNKDLVDSFIQGQNALAEQQSNEMHSIVGGKDNYESMVNWASENLTETESTAFNAIMEKGNRDEMQLAINGMNSRWKSSVGANEPRTIRGTAPKINSDVYKSTYEVAEAINNPKYAKDTFYRKQVEDKIKRSNILG